MIVPHLFSLNDATLSGGAAIVAAGGGLPRRITGAIDYEARVLALGPSAYWRMNEAAGNFLDRTANARPLTSPSTGYRGLPHHALGGCAGAAMQFQTYTWTAPAAGVYAEHNFQPGVPWSLLFWRRIWNTYQVATGTIMGTRNVIGGNFTRGWSVAMIGQSLSFGAGNGATSASLAFGSVAKYFTDEWTPFIFVYDGTDLALYVGGEFVGSGAFTLAGSCDPATRAMTVTGLVYVNTSEMCDVAIFQNKALSLAEVQSLSGPSVPCGTARWTLPVAAYDRTIHSIEFPGSLARIVTATETRKGVRMYLQLDSWARQEFDPGDDLSIVTVGAGQTAYIDADLTHHHLDDLPWIADSLGGGPVVLLEEADPPRHFATVAPVATDVGILAARTLPVEIV